MKSPSRCCPPRSRLTPSVCGGSSRRRGPPARSTIRIFSASTTSARTTAARTSVSELLDGETLRQRIGDSPLPKRKALDYAGQIAKGLAAAHDKGIVHRDLKPDNLFVTRDGRVKILDFGLAKMTEAPAIDSETGLAGPQTGAGTVLGTIGYMSPEQVRGQKVDQRSDIFSFGVVFYEMLTGRRAFQGDSAVETMNAILKEDPPLAPGSGSAIAPPLDRIVLHCLEKSPDERFQSARDIAFDLEALSGTSSQASIQSGPAGRRWLRPAVLALAAVVCAATVFVAGRSTASAPATSVFEPLTFRRGNVTFARFAPDGRTIVYGAAWEGGPLELYSTQPGSPESRAVGLQGDLQGVSGRGEMAVLLPRPGGNAVLARMPIGGGAPREILEHVPFADWGPDDDSLAVVHNVNGRDQIEYPIGHTLYQARGWLSDLAVSPKGDRVAFAEHPVAIDNRGDVVVVDLKGNKTTISAGWEDIFGVHWTPDSRRGVVQRVGWRREDGRHRPRDLCRKPQRSGTHRHERPRQPRRGGHRARWQSAGGAWQPAAVRDGARAWRRRRKRADLDGLLVGQRYLRRRAPDSVFGAGRRRWAGVRGVPRRNRPLTGGPIWARDWRSICRPTANGRWRST